MKTLLEAPAFVVAMAEATADPEAAESEDAFEETEVANDVSAPADVDERPVLEAGPKAVLGIEESTEVP